MKLKSKCFGFNLGSLMKIANIGQQALGTYQQARASYDNAQQAEQASADSRRRTRAINKLADQMSATRDPNIAAQATQDAGAQMAEQKQMSEIVRRSRQKNFVWAALASAAAGPAMDLAKQGVESGARFLTGEKSQEEAQADLAASQQAQAEATNRLAAASERAQARETQKQMSAPTQGGGSNFLGFAKDMGKVGWNMVKNNRKAFYAAGTAGALAAGMKYGVNKYIQRDMRKNNISMNQIAGNRDRQRYLAAGATPEQIEAHELQQQQRSYSFRSVLPLTTVATTAMSEAPTIAGYFGQRKQILKQRKMQAQLDRHAAATRQQPAPVQPQRPQQPQQAPVPGQQRTYSFASNKFIQSAFNTLKSVKPKSGYSFGKRAAVWGGKALDFGASLMGGGKSIVKSTGNLIKQQGQQSGNQWTQNAGNWIMNNQKKALIGSIGVGALMARGVAKAGKLGYKATDKALRTVDRNAYEYTDVMSGAVPRQQQYPNQQ